MNKILLLLKNKKLNPKKKKKLFVCLKAGILCVVLAILGLTL